MTIKSRLQALERASGNKNFVFTYPLFLDSSHREETYEYQLRDENIRAVRFPGLETPIPRNEGETFDEFSLRAHELVRNELAPSFVGPRGVHLL